VGGGGGGQERREIVRVKRTGRRTINDSPLPRVQMLIGKGLKSHQTEVTKREEEEDDDDDDLVAAASSSLRRLRISKIT
jgi:hypothetical protein